MVLARLEIIHQIVNGAKSSTHQLNIAIKVDLSKEFDRVEWSYLRYIMHRMDFPTHFMNLILSYLQTTKIDVSYIQSKTNYFKPTRGLR